MEHLYKVAKSWERRIEQLQAEARKLWAKACEFDDILADSPFVVFSKNNRWVKRHDVIVRNIQAIWSEYNLAGQAREGR